jgi:hypothetical protein
MDRLAIIALIFFTLGGECAEKEALESESSLGNFIKVIVNRRKE